MLELIKTFFILLVVINFITSYIYFIFKSSMNIQLIFKNINLIYNIVKLTF